MRLHLPGLPHTRTHPRYSCCAFTGKILRFAPMLAAQGFEVIHYGNEGSTAAECEQVTILRDAQFELLGGDEPTSKQFGTSAQMGSALYQTFNQRLGVELAARVSPGDIICLPFGQAHLPALHGEHTATLAQAFWVETGIGYPEAFAPFRIYESAAWMHYHLGKERAADGKDYWFTIPNFYDRKDWRFFGDEREDYVLFMGRLNADKGLEIVREIAKRRPSVQFVLCGQGDPKPWLTEANISYREPIHGGGRDELIGKARLLLAPTRYVEPFGGVAAEALMCGTPVAASCFGAFPEYITHQHNGHLCRTLADWLQAVDDPTTGLRRASIKAEAESRFSLEAVGPQYKAAFDQIAELRGPGWFTER